MAAYAASRPSVAAPGTTFVYSSGTSNIVSRALSDHLGLRGPDLGRWLSSNLFEPLGMGSPTPKFDQAGHWIASSYYFSTARDFARFGLLYLRDGVWDRQRLLPAGWVDHARTLTPASVGVELRPYGAHWWLNNDERGTFAVSGYAGQRIWLVLTTDLVIVRLDESDESHRDALLESLEAGAFD
ncbi:MAG: CubicO group peptidase (beta-lactamase class C family) [Candidatus Poriferisodalaceae bacterium]|jgi:CubicO group peptidase (beta-lactamase class C family)